VNQRGREWFFILILSAVSLAAHAQARPLPGPDVQQIYQRLLPQIEKIPFFDHHAHPGFFDDPDVDAMASPPGSAALRERDTNPELVAAAKALFAYPYNDLTPEHANWLVQKKAELKRAQGQAYFSNILDKLNIERGVANRALMADYLDPKRFPWVFFADSFMWPLNNARERSRNPDEQVYILLQEKMLYRWMQQEGVTKLPADFAGYLVFVSRTLEDNQKKGGIAMKFEVAYFRPTKFSDPTREEAEDIYQRFIAGGIPSEQEYRTFQDYIFRRGCQAASSGSYSLCRGHRRLFQPHPRQHHEPGKHSARSPLFKYDFRDDPRWISLRAGGNLARKMSTWIRR
jgi:hypothetical protein